ncbi:MAG: hypothetical protein RLZZ444_2564 [Pseudomonadota bacterium]|jgi:DNA-binding NarL/FixJ family response regulator
MTDPSGRSFLVLEDNGETRRWICQTLADHFAGARPLAAQSLAEAHRFIVDAEAGKISIELALIDIHLPDGSGIDIIRRISANLPETMPIVVTIYDDDTTLFDALAAGARGYVLKGVRTESLVEQLRRIESGEPPISPQIAHRILAYFRSTTDKTIAGSSDVSSPVAERLTQREEEILGLLGKGLTASDIGGLLGITRNTCTSHIKAIYRKLGISNRAEAALEANRRGLL